MYNKNTWLSVKNKIEDCKKLKSDWTAKYKCLNNNFNIGVMQLNNILNSEEDYRVKNKALQNLKILESYNYRKDFDNVVTIKLVIPSGCNANCKFCYMNDYSNMCYDEDVFLNNFTSSLEDIIIKMGDKQPISLDITGNEPTFNVDLLKKILIKLKSFPLKHKLCRTTITTNGFNLKKIIPYFKGVVDYVNISVHHYEYKQRQHIFGVENILKDIDYEQIVLNLLDLDIETSAIAVLYDEIDDFTIFMNRFVLWCKNIGFQSLRFRNDVFWEDSKFENYMLSTMEKENITVIQNEDTKDSRWCRLSDNEGFFIFFLNGVKDTSIVSKGIEFVISDDGKLYADFYKRTPIEEYDYPIGYVFDIK